MYGSGVSWGKEKYFFVGSGQCLVLSGLFICYLCQLAGINKIYKENWAEGLNENKAS